MGLGVKQQAKACGTTNKGSTGLFYTQSGGICKYFRSIELSVLTMEDL